MATDWKTLGISGLICGLALTTNQLGKCTGRTNLGQELVETYEQTLGAIDAVYGENHTPATSQSSALIHESGENLAMRLGSTNFDYTVPRAETISEKIQQLEIAQRGIHTIYPNRMPQPVLKTIQRVNSDLEIYRRNE